MGLLYLVVGLAALISVYCLGCTAVRWWVLRSRQWVHCEQFAEISPDSRIVLIGRSAGPSAQLGTATSATWDRRTTTSYQGENESISYDDGKVRGDLEVQGDGGIRVPVETHVAAARLLLAVRAMAVVIDRTRMRAHTFTSTTYEAFAVPGGRPVVVTGTVRQSADDPERRYVARDSWLDGSIACAPAQVTRLFAWQVIWQAVLTFLLCAVIVLAARIGGR